MKAIFIGAFGALLEGSGRRCLLRDGASAGLRLLIELDFRLIVFEDGGAAPDQAEQRPGQRQGQGQPQGQPQPQPQHRHQHQIQPATLHADDALHGGIAAGRRRDNGRRRRRTDALESSCAFISDEALVSNDADLAASQHSLFIDRLNDLLFREQLPLQGYYRCRHGNAPPSVWPAALAEHRCCRPPQPTLMLQAGVEHRIDLPASWLAGARLDDIEAGNRAGCRTLLIDNGSETRWQLGRGRVPTRIAPDLHDAARLIAEEGERQRS